MYKPFFGLQASPFKIDTDPTFLWLGEKHREAISMLKYGIMGDGHSGILLLTGDAGTGKTTLINALFKSVGQDVLRAAITNPNLAGMDFLNYIAHSFGSKQKFSSKSNFLVAFERFLKNAAGKNKKVLLVVDEAQLLTDDLLEEIRLLSNFNMDGQSLIHTFLVGQQELRDKLSRPGNRSLCQRITLNYHIDPLVAQETREYIKYRLQVAGTAEQVFLPDAVEEIHRSSLGLPRQINIICDHCLLTGYVRNTRQITIPIVQECVSDLSIVKNPTQPVQNGVPPQAPPPGYQPRPEPRSRSGQSNRGGNPAPPYQPPPRQYPLPSPGPGPAQPTFVPPSSQAPPDHSHWEDAKQEKKGFWAKISLTQILFIFVLMAVALGLLYFIL